jgi:hypothetical protein
MKKALQILFLLWFGHVQYAGAQLTNVQFIHNSPELGGQGGPALDVYINNVVLPSLRDFNFREATPFLQLPTDVELILQVRLAPSTPADSVVYTLNLGMLEDNKNYIASFSGLLGDLPGLPVFQLNLNENGKIASDDPTKVALSTLHGAILLPKISIKVRNGEELFLAEYSDYTPYTELAPDDYYLDIEVVDIEDLFYTHRLNLEGLEGQAATLFASGPAIGDPALGFFLALPDGTVRELPFSPIARIQWMHAMYGEAIDLYVNNEKIAEDIAFKGGTDFQFMPAEQTLNVGIAPAQSVSANDIIASTTLYLENRKTYSVVTSGIVDDVDFPFTLITSAFAEEEAAYPDSIQAVLVHSVAWVPTLQVSAQGQGVLFDSLGYPSFTSAFQFRAGRTLIDFRSFETGDLLATFAGNLPSEALGHPMTWIFGSLDPAEDDFFLTGIQNDGSHIDFTRVNYVKAQLIHNSPSSPVDIYINDFLLLDNFNYRAATPFVDLPAGIDISIGIAPANSQSSADTLANFQVQLDRAQTYHIIASGLPGNPILPLQLLIHEDARLAAEDPDMVDLVVYAGSQGAPDLNITARNGYPNFETLSYQEFSQVLAVEPDVYQLDVQLAEEDDTFITYEADLLNLSGEAGLLLVSGIFGGDPELGLFLVRANGEVIALPQRSFARVQIVHNVEDVAVDVYLDGNLLLDSFTFKNATPFLDLDADVSHVVAIAPENSADVSEAFAEYTLEVDGGKNYYAVATGIPGDADYPFDLIVKSDARLQAGNLDSFEFTLFHGLPGADPLSGGFTNDTERIQNLTYTQFSGYQSSDQAYRLFKLTDDIADNFLGALELDNPLLAGQAFPVIIGGNQTAHFFVVLPDGTVIDLPLRQLAHIQFVNNIPGIQTDMYINQRKERTDRVYLSATPFWEVVADQPVQFHFVESGLPDFDAAFLDSVATFQAGKDYAIFLNGDGVDPDFAPLLHIWNSAIKNATTTDAFQVALHRGTPFTGDLDFSEKGGADWFLGLPYGSFVPYRDLEKNYYIVEVADNEDYAGSFIMDNRTLKGRTGILFGSGHPENSPEFSLALVLNDGAVLKLSSVSFANAQWHHNAPQTDRIDLYLFDEIFASDLAFRSGTAFLEFPTNVNLEFSVYRAGSLEENDRILEFQSRLDASEDYYFMTQGIPGNTDYPLEVKRIDGIRTGAEDPDKFDMAIYNSAPGVNVLPLQLRHIRALTNGLAYGAVLDYQSITPTNYIVDMLDENSDILQTWLPDFFENKGEASLLVASGVTGSDDEPFGLFLISEDGSWLPLPEGITGRLQVINNTNLPEVDLYWNGSLIVSSLPAHRATSYVQLPAGEDNSLAIAPGGSQSVADAIQSVDISMANNQDFQAIAFGNLDDNSYPVSIVQRAIESLVSLAPDSSFVSIFHGADIHSLLNVESAINEITTISENLDYGQFSDFVQLEPFAGTLKIIDPQGLYGYLYLWTLQDLEGQVVTLFTTNGVDDQGNPAMDVWVALTNGITYPLDKLVRTTEQQTSLKTVSIYPNPVSSDLMYVTLETDLTCTQCSIQILDGMGRVVQIMQNGTLIPGKHTIGLNVPEGTGWHVVQMLCKELSQSKPFLINKQ